MRMAMVDVRVMRVLVDQRFVPVGVGMRLLAIPGKVMLVLVVLVMTMRVRVFHRFVRVLMLVPLAQMQPYAEGHQPRGNPEQDARHLGPDEERDHDAEQGATEK